MTAPTRFRDAGHAPSLVAALLHFDISFMVWVLLGALGASIAAELELSSWQKGLAVAVPPLGGAVFRILIGSIVDRVGLKRTGMVTLGTSAVPLLWGWQGGTSFVQVLCIGLLLGIAGASFVVALPLVSRWYPPEHQGLALGIAGAGNSGTIIAALAAPRIADHVGWHGAMGFALIPVGLAWVAFAVLAEEPPRPAAAATQRGMFSLLREPDARWLCLFYLVSFGGFVGLSGFLPIFFVDRFDLTKVTAASFAALCGVAGSLLRPLGGKLSDRIGGTRVLTIVLALISTLALGLATLPALATTVALLFVLLGCLGVANGAVFQLVPQRFPARIGAMTGLVGAAGGLGGFLLPFALGSLDELTGTFATGFVLYAAVAAVAVWAMVRRQAAWRAGWAAPNLEVAV